MKMKLPFHLHRKLDSEHAKCPGCKRVLEVAEVLANLRVCAECGHHFAMPRQERIDLLLDDGAFEPLTASPVLADPIGLDRPTPYVDLVEAERESTGIDEAAIAGTGVIGGHPAVLLVMDISFMRGSMGVAAGELVATAAEHAIDHEIPLVAVANSIGGVRVHEGAFALMQMAKTTAAIARLDRAGGLFISVIANPTMGGVMASFAALGDVTLAEPGATAGYTGGHIIQDALKKDVPQGFQTAEYMTDRGFVDAVVPRADLPQEIARVIGLCCGAPAAGTGAASAASE